MHSSNPWSDVNPLGGVRSLAAFLMFFLLHIADASAITCTQERTTFTVAFPATLSVTRDGVTGQALTGWTGEEIKNLANCSSTREAEQIGTYIYAGNLNSTGLKYLYGNDSYEIYDTGVAGVGIAIRTYTTLGGSCPAGGRWGPTDISKARQYDYHDDGTQALCKTEGITNGVFMGGGSEFVLVRTGRITGGTIERKSMIRHSTFGDGDYWYGQGGRDHFVYIPQIVVNAKSCATPSVTVDLGSHRAAELPSVGSKTIPVAFNVSVKDCDVSVTKVQLKVSSLRKLDPAKGLIGLSEDGTAKGVVVQLLWPNGDPVTLDQWFKVWAISATTNSTDVGMRAAIYRNDVVTEGTVKAEAEIEMWYE